MVTGASGFIGSHLCEALLDRGHGVIGIDAFIDSYPRWIKEKNLVSLRNKRGFEFIEGDILRIDLEPLLDGIDVVFHHAALAGVRTSWGKDFPNYLYNNVLATQRLLEHCLRIPLKLFVYASSSSIYGDTDDLPTRETGAMRPLSPYGVTKLAGENLCYLYWKNMGIPAVSLRFFTVYGPRQRPDMAFHRFIRAILKGEKISIFGNGEQSRDFTYISDVIDANLLCLEKDVIGESINIGGGCRTALIEVIDLIGEIAGKRPDVRFEAVQKGDVRHTWADTSKATKVLGYRPKISLKEGLTKEFEWLVELLKENRGGKQ